MDQQKVQLGTRAENLIKNENWIAMEQYVEVQINQLNDLIGRGTTPIIENGIIIKTANDVYRETVGKITALKDIKRDLERMVEVKNKIIKKYE